MSEAKCPVLGNAQTARGSTALDHWWPERLNLRQLRHNHVGSNPNGDDFDYAVAFAGLDVDALKADMKALMTDSQDWWPADYGHYGPFFVRLSWHAAGTYRIDDGRGGAGSGQIRFAPLGSWPDNASLDKAKRLLWPIKQKYGSQVSWADLIVLAGTIGMEDMGLPLFGFAFGRADVFAPDEDVYWGKETEWLGDQRYTGDRELENPLGAVQMGLIYVNPEGPNGSGDPLAAARDIRETFRRMAMNDEETVALIAGGHTFGKAHGASVSDHIGREPEAAPIEQQGLGWRNSDGTGVGEFATTSGLEGAWTTNPKRWDNGFFDVLFGYEEWEKFQSPAGATQWRPVSPDAEGTVPDAHRPGVSHKPIMLTTDMALKLDPVYGPISKRFHENPAEFTEAYAKAWYKLTHRDMGPHARLLGPDVPPPQLWQDPVDAGPTLSDADVAALKDRILGSGLTVSQLVKAAWASASSFRGSDKRGGANGARVALAPQKDWEANDPAELASTLYTLREIQASFGAPVSLADLIVLGGVAAVEKAAADAGYTVTVPFVSGRGDATQENTDVESFEPLEPRADGFRNYVNYLGGKLPGKPEELLIDKAQLLKLTVPELTALVGGLRVLGANAAGSTHGVFTDRVGQLTNDWFVNLLDMGTVWAPSGGEGVFAGTDRATGAPKYTATSVDLVFGANSELRAVAEEYALSDSGQKFADAFAAAFSKVMHADRFDVA